MSTSTPTAAATEQVERAHDFSVKPALNPGSRTCQCCECGLFFTAISAFDAHRVGSPERRKCRTQKKMVDLGMNTNEHGVWSAGSYRNPDREED